MLAEINRQRWWILDSNSMLNPRSVDQYYGVKRHSLQAQLARPAGDPIRARSFGRST